MKKIIKYIVGNLVEKPESIKIEEEEIPSGLIIYHLTVAPEDMGKIIGKRGKVIKSIRDVLKIKGMKENLRFSLNLKEQT